MPYTQANRLLRLETPLGDDVLLLEGFTGQEGISQIFKFDLDLMTEGDPIDFNKIIGEQVTIQIELIDGTERFMNGHISRFAQTGSESGVIHYRAEMVPWLWFLTRTADCRIFQNKKIPDIIEQIFKDLGFTDYKLDLQGTYDPVEYCVQYRETDFNFVSRLMEQYGIFYFFEHEEEKHTLVLADSPPTHQPVPTQPTVNYEPKGSGTHEKDVITSLEFEKEIRPGKYTHTDYNFTMPSTKLEAEEKSIIDIGGNNKYEIYDYPGEYPKKANGSTLAKIRMQEEEAQHFIITGSSTCRAFLSGYKFDLADYKPQDLNQPYLLTEIQHMGSMGDTYTPGAMTGGEEAYSNTFMCIPHSVPYRPAQITPKPVVQGPQTAMVVGPSGEEIWCDEYARVKVQFHWDREGQKDENSSCWLLVSQVHAGKGFGGVDTPRIGEEVIVSFMEGDPDRPIVTGRVYNAENMPPNPLPDGGMVSGLKSNSTPGGGGSNSMMMDDTKGKEAITIHGQYDMSTTVENDMSTTVVGGNETHSVSAGTQSVTIQGNTSLTVNAGDRIVNVTGNYTLDTTAEVSIQAPTKITLTCGGSTITMEPGKITLAAGDGASLTLDANALMESADGSKTMLDANATVSSPAEAKVDSPKTTVSGGGATVVNDASGVAVTGPKISLNG